MSADATPSEQKAAVAAKPAPAKAPVRKPQAAKKPADDKPEPHYDFNEVVPAGLRPRHFFLIGTFLLIVVIPAVIAAWISWSFAGTLRQVTASVTVQEQSLGVLGNSTGGDTLRSAFSGSGAEETAIVRQLVNSQDFYRTIREQVNLAEIWPEDRVVPYLPTHFDPDATVEDGHRFWLNMVSVNLGSRDNIIRVTVTAFDQQSAERLLLAIRNEAERRLNLARAATLAAARNEAEARLEELKVQNAEDRQALMDFRLASRTIDPKLLAAMNTELRNNLRQMRTNEEIMIAEAEASVGQGGVLTRRPEDRIAAIEAYMNDAEANEGSISTTSEIAQLMDAYQPLLLEAELSGTALRSAELSIIYYNRELESNKVFLTSVTGGNSAAIRLFPQFGPTLLVVLVSTFIIWCMVLLIFYAIRDRK